MQKLIRPILILATVGLLAVVSTSCSRRARAARRLDQANRYFDGGQYDKAEIEYMNALRLEALNPQAIGRLGLIYFDQGRSGRAIPFLLKCRELQPENLEARLKLGVLFLTTGKAKEARDEASFVLDRKPQDAEAPLLLAETVVRPKDVEEVRQRLQHLPPPAAGGAPVAVALGTLDLRQRKLGEAEAAFTHAVELDPKFAPAHSALGALYRAQGNLPKAEDEYKKAADLSPARSSKRIQYAQFKIQSGDLEGGKRLLTEMTHNTPDYLPAWVWLAEIAAAEKKYDESAAFVARVLARDGMQPEAMLLSARLKLAKNEPDKAVAELERMAKIYPQSPQVHYQLGLAYLANGDTGKATTSLNQAVTLAPSFADAIVVLAGLQIRKGDLNAAIVALKKLAQQRPDLPQVRLLLADAYRGQGSLDDALDVYRQLEAQFPKNPRVSLLAGLVLVQQNKRDEARKAFEKAVELAPDYLPALEQLVNLDLFAKQYAVARERVESQVAKNPKQAGPRLLLAKIYLAQNDASQAEVALRKAIDLEPEATTPYFLLAQLYVSTNQNQKALASLQEVAAKNPKDVGAQMLIGVIHDQQKNWAAARDAYEKLLAVNPRFGPALNNLAWLYSEHLNQLEKAYELAQKARELQPNEPHMADTLGWILSKQHQYPWALTLLQESADKLPNEPEVQFHLGMTHYMMGEEEPARVALQRALQINQDFPGADEARQCLSTLEIDIKTTGPQVRTSLEKTVAQRPGDPVALARLASVYARDGAVDKAIGAYEAALRANPKNVAAMKGLAQLYAGQGDLPKALDAAKNARKLAPDDAGMAYLLGRLAFQTGDYPWAMSVLQEAARKQPDDPDVQFDFAQAAYSMGRAADAEAAMRHALQANAAFPRAEEARRFLDLVALAANPADAATSLAKTDQVLKSDPGNVPALMVVAAANEQKPDVAAAKQTYERILGHYPGFAPAQRRLAILYSSSPGDSQKALDAATKARQAFPDDPELAKAFGIIEYRQGDYARAASLLEESAGKRDSDGELIYYLGMAQLQLNKKVESKKTLQRALDLGLKDELAAEARKSLAKLK